MRTEETGTNPGGPLEVGSRTQTEISTLQKYGLRWAVLAAWADELEKRKTDIELETKKRLEAARVKIASGCFSSCEVGCDLGAIEGALVSRGASSSADSINFWIELLGHAMEDSDEVEQLLRIPAVRFRYTACGFGPCRCG
jgi:hypothetical protein